MIDVMILFYLIYYSILNKKSGIAEKGLHLMFGFEWTTKTFTPKKTSDFAEPVGGYKQQEV